MTNKHSAKILGCVFLNFSENRLEPSQIHNNLEHLYIFLQEKKYIESPPPPQS